MNIAQIIANNPTLTTLAEAADWEAVVAAWPQIRLPDHRASGRETLVALASAGIDANEVLTAVEATPTGRRLLGLLDSAGVNWADPVTQQLLNSVVASGGITQQTADVLTSVSLRIDETPTAAQVQAEWLRHKISAWWVARRSVVSDGIFNGTITTQQQVIDAIGGA